MKNVDMAMRTHETATKGLKRSPVTANLPNMPMNPGALGACADGFQKFL